MTVEVPEGPAVTLAPRAESEWRKGWRPAVAAALGWGTAGVLFTNTASLFIEPIAAETRWSTSQVLLTPIVGIGMAVCAPFVGKAVQRFGPRRVVLTGLIGVMVLLVLLVTLPLSLAVYYSIGALLGVFLSGVSMVPWNRTVVNWFHDSAGKALSLMGLTAGLSVAILSPILVAAISQWGWRSGYLIIVGILLVVTVPITFWGIRVREHGAATAAQRHADPETEAQPALLTIGSALRNRDVWFIGLCFAFMVMPIGGFMANMFPVLTLGGLNPASAAVILSSFFVAAALGRVVSGVMLDVMPRYVVAVIFMACGGAGALLLALDNPLGFVPALIAVVAFASIAGGEIEMMSYFILRELGEKSFAVAFGVVVLIFSVCSMAAPYLFSVVRDTTGSYTGALIVSAIVCVLGAGAFLFRAATVRSRLDTRAPRRQARAH